MPTLLEKLTAAGLPVLEATESGAVSTGPMTPEQESTFHDILLEHFQPAAYQEVLNSRIDIAQLKDEYQAMITRLEQIQAAANPTNAQVIQAIKDEALYIERIMKVLKRLLT